MILGIPNYTNKSNLRFELYPSFEWFFNDIKFKCIKKDSYLFNISYIILCEEPNGKLHTIRTRDKITNPEKIYNLFNEWCNYE